MPYPGVLLLGNRKRSSTRRTHLPTCVALGLRRRGAVPQQGGSLLAACGVKWAAWSRLRTAPAGWPSTFPGRAAAWPGKKIDLQEAGRYDVLQPVDSGRNSLLLVLLFGHS